MTQEEFVSQLREMNEDIARAWLGAERVTALKLATRVARLLCDTSVPSFYPTLFVLVTEVMDTMGRLVFSRIHAKAEREDDGTVVASLPAAFSVADVRQDAKDTCLNWFYKIGAVRDLLPRVYMELAILRCYHFLQAPPPRAQLARLAAMQRGLGDPLAAAYARAFLGTRAAQLLPGETSVLESALSETCAAYCALAARPSACAACAASGLAPADYLALLEPPLEWLLAATVRAGRGDGALHMRLLALAGDAPPLPLLVALQAALPLPFVAAHARPLLRLLRDAGEAGGARGGCAYARSPSALRSQQLRRLGEATAAHPPAAGERAALLRDAWRQAGRLAALGEYLVAAAPWLDFSLRHFGAAELSALLEDAQTHVAAAGAAEVAAAREPLAELLRRSLEGAAAAGGAAQLLRLPPFLPLLDALPACDARSALLRDALTALTVGGAALSGAGELHFALDACRALAEAAAAEPGPPGEAERRDAGRLAARVLACARFGGDLEAHLEWLVAARAQLWQLPAVAEATTCAALRLAAQALAARRDGAHGGRSGGFVRACLAFAHVTLPSLVAAPRRAALFCLAGRCALTHGLLPHADSLLRCAVADCAAASDWGGDGAATAEAQLLPISAALCATLVAAPGHPERGALHLLRPLCDALRGTTWAPETGAAAMALLPPLRALHALRQRALPYAPVGVECNDVLYAGDAGYTAELDGLAAELAIAAVAHLAGGGRDGRKRAIVRLHTAATLLLCFSPAAQEVREAADALVTRAAEALPADDPLLRATVRFAKTRMKAARAAAA
jgi:hypothetical protein